MRSLISLVILVVSLGSFALHPASAQVVYDPYPQFYQKNVKPLPPGFHDFIVHPNRSETAGSLGIPLCQEWRQAISLGKRIGLGMNVVQATEDISREQGGNVVCGFKSGLRLTPWAYAVRGDDQTRPIAIIEFHDEDGNQHYTGYPLGWGKGQRN